MLLACLLACQEQTAMLTHSPLSPWQARLSPASRVLSSRGQSIAPTPLPPWSTGRQVQHGGL